MQSLGLNYGETYACRMNRLVGNQRANGGKCQEAQSTAGQAKPHTLNDSGQIFTESKLTRTTDDKTIAADTTK